LEFDFYESENYDIMANLLKTSIITNTIMANKLFISYHVHHSSKETIEGSRNKKDFMKLEMKVYIIRNMIAI
jgi:hypothetical protein